MTRTFTRSDIAALTASGNIDQFDGQHATVGLQGADFPVTLRTSEDGSIVTVFDTPGIYFGKSEHMIASPIQNNFTAHVLDHLVLD